MNTFQITLNHIFAFQEKKLSKDQLGKIESTEGVVSLKGRILKEIPEIKWPVKFDDILKKIEDLLNIPLSDIMVKAWNKHRLLKKYLDKTRYSPEETVLVPLAEHTIKSEHRPYIEILINDQPVGKIEFAISVTITLQGIILKIQNGRIKEIRTGTCKGKGTIKYENIVILEKNLGSISLPGSIDLEEGSPIAT